jgi:DNA-binding response OmpR family regulator
LFNVFLKKIGFSRVVVGTVKEALAALDKQHFDLLFLDLKLPDGPADDVMTRPRKSIPSCRLSLSPVIPTARCSIGFWKKGRLRF